MIVDSSSHRNTHENRYKLTLTGSSVVERSCVINDTCALAIHNSVLTAEDTHHESPSCVAYPVYDEVGQAHLYQTSQPEGSSSLSQTPFPYLVPCPSVGKGQANEINKMIDRPSTINQDVSGITLQSNISYCKLASYCQSSSSASASNILSPTSIDSTLV